MKIFENQTLDNFTKLYSERRVVGRETYTSLLVTSLNWIGRKCRYALNDAVWNFYGQILQIVEESKFVIDLGSDMFSVMEHCH